jgi:hypothetical protein
MTYREPYPVFDDYEDEPEERKPVVRDPVLPRCPNCKRNVTDDGKNGFVHVDDLRYSCNFPEPGPPFAGAVL